VTARSGSGLDRSAWIAVRSAARSRANHRFDWVVPLLAVALHLSVSSNTNTGMSSSPWIG